MANMDGWTYGLVVMSARMLVAVGLIAATALGCATTRRAFDYGREPDPRSREYVVGPSDQLRINVWRDSELSLEIRVRPDGTFTMPLVGDVVAAGHTPTQIRDELARRLAHFVKIDPTQVTVAVLAVNSYRFSVAGNVEHPGLFTPPYYVTVIEALALAGGPNRFAAPERAVIVRTYGRDGGARRIPIDYDTLKTGERPEQNIVILPGDTIFVP
jgi:polysaccharide export outer membrane protein